MKIRISILAILIALFSITCFTQSPTTTVTAFYRFDRSHGQTFNRRNIDARKGWFSKELYSLFLYELKRENEYLKKNPTDKPYFGDGLPFQPIDEICKAAGRNLHRSFIIKPAFLKGNRAAVTAGFPFPKPCKDTDAPTYTIGLVKQGATWVIDDVNYGDDRTLKDDLKRKEY